MNLRKNLFVFNDSWIWAAIVSFILAVSVLAARYQFVVFNPLGVTIVGSVIIVFLGLIAARYIIRAKYLDEWNEAYQCDAGCAVINRGLFKDVDYDLINNTVSDAAQYWIDWARTRSDAPAWVNSDAAVLRLENTLEYKTIFLVKGPIELYNPYYFGKATGLVKEDGTPATEVTVNHIQQVAGYVDNNGNIIVSGNAASGMYELVKHEVSHPFLTALGYPAGPNGGEFHHKIFAETGYC
jgi:hypothetical protein